MNKTAVSIISMAVFAAGALALGPGAAFGAETVKNLTLPAAGLDKFEITAGAGFLKVAGRDGLQTIEVEAKIVVEGERDKDLEGFIKDYVELELKPSGSTAVLVSRIRQRGFFHLFTRNARIDLTVSVPKGMKLDIDDGSGELEVRDMAADVRIEDGSGETLVERIGGNVWIDDGSGGLDVRDITGNLEIIDGSGEIDVRNVTGDVAVDDGSGSMTLRKIGGGVTIEDGSGSITVDDVGKDVRLRSTGSGGVDVTNVRGKVIK